MKNIKSYELMLSESSSKDLDEELVYCVKMNRLGRFWELLKEGADPNARDDHQRTALAISLEKGHIEMFYGLMDAGADPKLKIPKTTHLCLSISHDPEVMKRILEAGADPNEETEDHMNTPLGLICYELPNRALEKVKILLEAGASPNSKVKHFYTAFFCAIVFRRKEISKELMNAGAETPKTFDDINSVAEFFEDEIKGADIDWMPADLREKIKKLRRSRGAFGRF